MHIDNGSVNAQLVPGWIRVQTKYKQFVVVVVVVVVVRGLDVCFKMF